MPLFSSLLLFASDDIPLLYLLGVDCHHEEPQCLFLHDSCAGQMHWFTTQAVQQQLPSFSLHHALNRMWSSAEFIAEIIPAKRGMHRP